MKTIAKTKKNPSAKSNFSEEEPLFTPYHKEPEEVEPELHWTEDEPRNQPDEIDTLENLVHLYL